MDKKYEINSEGRIVALRPGLWGPVGTVGGFVDGEHNLSQGWNDCWVYDDAKVRDHACVDDGAEIRGKALVADRATVCDQAMVTNYVVVCGDAALCDEARAMDCAVVSEHSRVFDRAVARGTSTMKGRSILRGSAELIGGAYMRGGVICAGVHSWVEVWADCESYPKSICEIEGVAWVGAGCRWMTLADAIRHWSFRVDRQTTRALLAGAIELARVKGLRHE